MKKTQKQHGYRAKPESNIIPLAFEKAIEGLLQVKPKKKRAKRKQKADK